jgi:transcriptional regulator with XRE-family HTH domain
MTIGKNIREIRLSLGLTQAELGEKIGVDQKVITSYERGVSTPPVERLVKIAKIYGVSLDELVGLEKTKKQVEKTAHKNKRSVKVQELFEKLPVNQQRALLNMIQAAAAK